MTIEEFETMDIEELEGDGRAAATQAADAAAVDATKVLAGTTLVFGASSVVGTAPAGGGEVVTVVLPGLGID